MKIQPSVIVKKLFMQGKIVTVNQEIDYETAEEIALEFDVLCEKEEVVDVIEELLKEDEEDEKKMKKRPPVVCVMGHVDHGKPLFLTRSVILMSSQEKQVESHSISVLQLWKSTVRKSPSSIHRDMKHLPQCVCVVQILPILQSWLLQQMTVSCRRL